MNNSTSSAVNTNSAASASTSTNTSSTSGARLFYNSSKKPPNVSKPTTGGVEAPNGDAKPKKPKRWRRREMKKALAEQPGQQAQKQLISAGPNDSRKDVANSRVATAEKGPGRGGSKDKPNITVMQQAKPPHLAKLVSNNETGSKPASPTTKSVVVSVLNASQYEKPLIAKHPSALTSRVVASDKPTSTSNDQTNKNSTDLEIEFEKNFIFKRRKVAFFGLLSF